MGKKSRRNNKNNGGPLRKEGLAAIPTAAASTSTLYDTICRLMQALKYDEILKVESKYRHLNTFSDDPSEDAYILSTFGRANYANSIDGTCLTNNRAVDYYERAKERMEDVNANDQRETQKSMKSEIGFCLALLYSDSRDMEKAISSHRWLLVNCSRHQVLADYVFTLSSNFTVLKKFEYAMEVMEGSMDMMKTPEDEVKAEYILVRAYIGCGEFLKAKAAIENRRSTYCVDGSVDGLELGRIEEGMCNYEAAIAHFRIVVEDVQMQEYEYVDSFRETRSICSVGLARNLLRHSAANEAEAFAIFQEELDRCKDPLSREKILIQIGTEYRKLNKWDQSIETLRQLCLSSTRPHGTMLPQANIAMAQTYLEQYCTDTALDIDQRTQILRQAKMASLPVDEVSTEMHLTRAQLFYFNGDKRQAYHHLELYLDARLAECKLRCCTCQQRVRHGSVPFSCASCLVASYCGRKHQKLTWKNERICHKVLCPLFGYWRMAKKKQKKHKGIQLTNEDQCEYERVFDTFFESICPHELIIVEAKEKQLVLLGEDALLK